jgi:hypothetical protein
VRKRDPGRAWVPDRSPQDSFMSLQVMQRINSVMDQGMLSCRGCEIEWDSDRVEFM